MKAVKYLFILACITFATSTMGINAAYYNPYNISLMVPPSNGSVVTPNNTKKTISNQKISGQGTTPIYDPVDIRLKIRNKNGSIVNASDWRVIDGRTGKDLIYNLTNERLSGTTYFFYIDSRINYTRETRVYGKWYIDI